MSSPRWKTDVETGVTYRVGHADHGERVYQIDNEQSDWLSEGGFTRALELRRTMPRDHRRHEPDNVPEYRKLPAPAEPTPHRGPLRAPGPHENRLFPADPTEDQSQEQLRRPHYEIAKGGERALFETAASRTLESAREVGYGAAPSLANNTRTTDSGAVSNSNFQNTDPTGLSRSAPSAPPPQLSPLARSFVSIGLGNYSKSSDFILDHPLIVAKKEINALTAEALAAEKAGQSTRAQTCIHQALLLRECKEVGQSNINSFFRKLTAKDGKAKDTFVKDVKKVYSTIQEQARMFTQQNQRNTPESDSLKVPLISQETGQTSSRSTSGYPQTLTETSQPQAPMVRDKEGRRYYTDNQGNVLRPATNRHDSDRHRSVSDPAEITGRIAAVSIGEGTKGSTNAVSGRGNALGRSNPLQRVTSDPTRQLPILPEDPQLGPNKLETNSRSTEKLNERYRIRPDARKFFKCGRVFAVLWPEPAGNGGGRGSRRGQTEPSDYMVTRNTFGESVFVHIRRMVVVKEDHGFCLCLPINTYKGKGVAKYGFSEDDRRAHSIIYMTGDTPWCSPEEERYLDKKPIAVDRTSDDQKLDCMSRLNYRKMYTVEHNYKVMGVGRVTRDSLPVLSGYWRNNLQD